ncbi:alcohol dehydrogenase catalytic domain-containing protein [Streptomyces bikiniensis]|uniref:Alcohol dehydrogenase catalytic domain-containing protein n=1 Tax=Streptomyces bikiniensis TaxID=1896 RepID=A0ABW8CX09_STRBI
MKAVVWRGIGNIGVEDVPEPTIKDPYDAIVRITTSAVCGTDLHFVRCTMPGMEEGRVLGHEAVGVVEEVGPAVRNLRPGDRVVVPSTVACGVRSCCRTGYYAQCDNANPGGPSAGTVFFGGPQAAGVCLLSPDDPVLGLMTVCGLPAKTVEPWWRVSVSAAGPLSEAVREDRLVWVGRQEDMARLYPNAAAGLPYQFALAFTPLRGSRRRKRATIRLPQTWPAGPSSRDGNHQDDTEVAQGGRGETAAVWHAGDRTSE